MRLDPTMSGKVENPSDYGIIVLLSRITKEYRQVLQQPTLCGKDGYPPQVRGMTKTGQTKPISFQIAQRTMHETHGTGLNHFICEIPTSMSYFNRLLSSSISRLGYLFCILLLPMGTICHAKDPEPTPPPAVFQPHEIQHGFAEFDSLPDFFEDEPLNTSAPYKEYSSSPNLPSFDHTPGGLFESLVFAESVEEGRTIRRGHILVPVNPTDTFSPSAKAVHLVFAVHKHLAPYQIIGRLFPEQVPDADSNQWIDEDRADLALEDESGYLKFFAPDGKWKPGHYRVDVYVGYMVNTMNKMGTMRFSVNPKTPPTAVEP